MGRSRLILAIAAAAVVAAGVFLFTRADKARASEAAKGAAPRAVPVLLANVEKKDVPIWLEGLGTVAAFQQVSVRPQVDGKLEKVFFKEGEAVKKGQVLAEIDQ